MTQIAKFRGFNGYDDFQVNDTRAFLGEIIYYFSKLLKNRKLINEQSYLSKRNSVSLFF